ncbi:hypothetical protein BGX20_005971 [Mortierella sp. AD010]|nr:hypothetical protein BGX20_005971 [Mortierella sp. AD010]
MLNQYPYNSTPNRTGFNSSPLPVASYVPQPKLTGIAQQQQALQHHQQQHHQQRHSTGSAIGSPLSNTGMTTAQQQSRFGAASPSPPPLPPPPRALTGSPSLGTGTPTSTVTVGGGGATGGLNRPPVPARPGRSSDQADLAASGGGNADHVTTMERTMTPPRPPLPPPPPGSQGAGGNGIVSSSAISSSIPVSSGGAASVGGQLPSSLGVSGPTLATANRPALKPRPPKEHEILQGIIGTKKTPAVAVTRGFQGEMGPSSSSTTPLSAVGGIGGTDVDDVDHQAAPPNANMLIEQLVNMGFTREQSRSALQKYDYDLEKATNHLLDYDD